MRLTILIYVSVLLLASQALAQEKHTYSFYRDGDGSVSAHAKDQAELMLRYAKEHGQITLWLTLNYSYNVDFENMTPQELNTQETEVAQRLNEILAPLLSRGDAWHPDSGVFIRGPGCTVRVTAKGLKRLLRDGRLYQISSFD